jgi:hypothetical protein
MLQLANRTPYGAERAVLLDLDGSEIWVVAVKATFEIHDARLVVAEKQDPVRLVDEYYGEPGTSSIKYESELAFRKPGTDVVINGQAHAPGGRAISKLDVSVQIGDKNKVIRVYGDRHWTDAGGITSPKPFISMPLLYERAFGGTDVDPADPSVGGAEPRNPIGTGFGVSKKRVAERPLPNLEDPSDEMTAWNSRPRPQGVGFIGKHWEPRRRFTGTCDQQYIENRLPLYPLDFDPRFFLGATPDLAFVPHLRGGESVMLQGMTPAGRFAFSLPQLTFGFRTRLRGKWVDHQGKLGTVLIEPDLERVMLTWHTFLPCHRQTFDLEQTVIFEKERL